LISPSQLNAGEPMVSTSEEVSVVVELSVAVELSVVVDDRTGGTVVIWRSALPARVDVSTVCTIGVRTLLNVDVFSIGCCCCTAIHCSMILAYASDSLLASNCVCASNVFGRMW